MTTVDFHFDVMCPWAYQTALWIRQAATTRPITLRWRFFSLEEVNRDPGKKHPWERPWSYGWSLMRVGARLGRDDPDLVGEWYLAAGRALHEHGRKVHTREVAERVVAEMGLDPGLVGEAVEDPSTNDAVLADHQRVIDAGGFGVPTLFLDGTTCLFGPVVAPAPSGEEAGRMWDLVAGWAAFPHLYELRRPKTEADGYHLAGLFKPTLDARDWRSVQRPVP